MGRLGHRPSDEDRRGLGRPAPHRRRSCRDAGPMTAPHPFGLHRSLDPPGVLPQLARRLDATPRALENEIAVSVRALSIDSASFRQLRETEAATGETVRDQILRIVHERGKMQNPVTGSGGMLLGEVAAVGPRHPAAGNLLPGTPIASLVSLTLTPLSLESIGAVHPATERVEARRHGDSLRANALRPAAAGFPGRGRARRLRRRRRARRGPARREGRTDRPRHRHREGGAPVSRRRARGRGRQRACSRGRARPRRGRPRPQLSVSPTRSFRSTRAIPSPCSAAIEEATSRRARGPRRQRRQRLGDRGRERPLRPGRRRRRLLRHGDVLLGRGALGAEGLAKPTRLSIGNGFVPGHDGLALDLLRRHPALARAFSALAGRPGA